MNTQWKLVPVEPTQTMVINGFESEPDECFTDEEVWEQYQEMSGCQQAAFRAKLCWAAMLASAPEPPPADADEVSRLTAERDALQLLLNDRDEQLHTFEQSRRSHFNNAQAAERRIDLLENALREIVHNYNHGHLQHTHKAIVAAEELIEPAETEPNQGIPGTSFQRLNMLANQGE